MKLRNLLGILFIFLSFPIFGQSKFGYVSVQEIMQQMPEYQTTLQKLQDLKKEYDKETEWTEKEFQTKFAEFLQGQSDFPDNILLKRQNELNSLMESGIKFRKNAEKELKNAEEELYAELKKKIYNAIRRVGFERNFAYILNTDADVYPFINNLQGIDATEYVKEKLGLIAPQNRKEDTSLSIDPPAPESEEATLQTDSTYTIKTSAFTIEQDSIQQQN